ncbi:GSCFA domain-containing protein [Flavobacterium celericrescens]|uniref:GSCFA domain-containing protein n=1 Tax=Flavobacterium celericrescens TaxID=2709780 RepID=A0ABX0IBQ0_9FLAO|nr:GSCFA domain-containing protein [Flavobacterium celericrescens]NHM04492.1 GSCFA domain-containing protein [Flavobacterium celericrescens]
MNFTTKIPIQKSNLPIDYASKIVLLGSCFAENMGEKFEYFKFQTAINPFGIIFNLVSLCRIIERSVQKNYFTENDIFFHNELWHCFDVHSELSNSDKDAFLESLNDLINSTNKQLNDSTHIIITLGTSWVYRNIETNEIVANCHKVPQKQFTKELLSIETIVQSLESILFHVSILNPNCNFIFTVSPVRHIKDGFVENTLSKAHLIAGIHNLKLETRNLQYFPAYEIMMDELRDYRFYTEDMLHPNQTAIDYIWIKFFENYISESEFGLMNQICEIQRALKHRPFNPNTANHQNFLASIDTKILKIQEKLPTIQF